MARYIVSYRISRYWGCIVAYLYRDNYTSNEAIFHTTLRNVVTNIPRYMLSAASTNWVSCSVARAEKVKLIGSNCPASWVGRCVDCEGGRMAQIFIDSAITKYLSHATTRRPFGHQTAVPCANNGSCGESPHCLAPSTHSTHSSPAEWPWTSKKPANHHLAGQPVSRHLQWRECW